MEIQKTNESRVARTWLQSRLPFVFQGPAPSSDDWNYERLESLSKSHASTAYWFDLTPDAPALSALEAPGFYLRHLAELKGNYIQRPKHIRIWATRQETTTAWHYDGNALDVLNYQICGSKTFRLAPVTDHRQFARLRTMHVAGYDFGRDRLEDEVEVSTSPGDILYIPRFWLHHTVATGAWNVNANWVWTDLTTSRDEAGLRHEARRLSLMIRSLSTPDRLHDGEIGFAQFELSNYAGGGPVESNPVVARLLAAADEIDDADWEEELAKVPFGEIWGNQSQAYLQRVGRHRTAEEFLTSIQDKPPDLVSGKAP